jgi:surfactin synthase thioesterase subunit
MRLVATAPDAWLPLPPDPAAEVRLYCFPYAGGGVQAFHDWRVTTPQWISCLPVRLPGREARLGEPAMTRVEPLLDAMAEVLAASVAPPYAIYGHSMGAAIAFELALRLRELAVTAPLGVIVSGRPAPHIRLLGPCVADASDRELTAELRSLGGLPDLVAANDELLRFFLPLLRADLELNEAYHRPPDVRLDVPLTAIAGAHDPRVRVAEVAAWERHTTADFAFHACPGGHFFPFDRPPGAIRIVSAELERWNGRRPGNP